MKIIAISGTPGTGKTALAKELSLLLRYRYIDTRKLAKRLSEGYDKIKRTYIVDHKKLNKALIALIKAPSKAKRPVKGLIIDSHMSHFLPHKLVDLCIVTMCSLKTLQKRLTSRGYSDQKVRENLDAEIFEICLLEAKQQRHKVLVIDTAKKSPKTLAKQIAKQFIKLSKNLSKN